MHIIENNDEGKMIFSLEEATAEIKHNESIRGHLQELSDGRLVFVGERPEREDCYYVAFQNPKGHQTKLMLSKEAVEALAKLYFKQRNTPGDKVFPLKITTQWVVKEAKKENPES